MKLPAPTKKNIAILSIIALVLFIIYLLLPKPEPQKLYSSMKFDLKSTFVDGEDFTLTNEISVNANPNNYVYEVTIRPDLTKVRSGANKSGLTKESSNAALGVYLWQYSDPAKTSGLITYNQTAQTLEFNVPEGIGTNLDKTNTYQYLKDFFGLDLIEAEVIRESDSNDIKTFIYGAKRNSQPIYTTGGNDFVATIDVKGGRIIYFNLNILPSNVSQDIELKPLMKVGRDNISGLYYEMKIEPDTIVQSDLGGEATFQGKAKISMKQSSNAYYRYYDPFTKTVYLIPSLLVTGNYLDDQNNVGKFNLLVLNQDPRPNQ